MLAKRLREEFGNELGDLAADKIELLEARVRELTGRGPISNAVLGEGLHRSVIDLIKEKTMLFEVAILEKTDNETKLILGPMALVAASRDAAIVMASVGLDGEDTQKNLEVLVRPFVGG
jgi:hypothetical protein